MVILFLSKIIIFSFGLNVYAKYTHTKEKCFYWLEKDIIVFLLKSRGQITTLYLLLLGGN